MAISAYEKEGKTLWSVYINLRSKKDPKIRLQKRVSDLESEEAAKAEEKRLIRKLSERIGRRENEGSTWESIIGKWEVAARESQNYHSTTIRDYIACLNKWTKDWLKVTASTLNKGDGREVLSDLKADGRSISFQKKVKHTINVVYGWAIEQQYIRNVQSSPTQGLKVRGEKAESVPEILTIEQIRDLLQKAKSFRHKWYPIWAMALLTGMRNGELHALLWSDVDLEKRRITVSKSYNCKTRSVKSTKSGSWRTVPISNQLYELLVELKRNAGDRKNVLPRIGQWNKGEQARILRMFCIGAGIPSIRFHTLRACFATQLLANDIAPVRVMKICGWKDMKTMQHYIRMAGIDEKGATECLKLLSSDEEAVGTIVNLLDFKNRSKNNNSTCPDVT